MFHFCLSGNVKPQQKQIEGRYDVVNSVLVTHMFPALLKFTNIYAVDFLYGPVTFIDM